MFEISIHHDAASKKYVVSLGDKPAYAAHYHAKKPNPFYRPGVALALCVSFAQGAAAAVQCARNTLGTNDAYRNQLGPLYMEAGKLELDASTLPA